MKNFKGRAACGGAALGRLRLCRMPEKAERSAKTPAEELLRLESACKAAEAKLEALAEKAREESLGEEAAALFETHALMLRDEELQEDMRRGILEKGLGAKAAVSDAAARQAALFEALEDDYMKARGQDIRELEKHLISALSPEEDPGVFCEEECILGAKEFAAADILALDKRKVKGLLCAGGTGNSHAAVLARIKAIPMIVGLGEEFLALRDGCEVFMDGEAGEVTAEPDEIARKAALEKLEERKMHEELFAACKDLPAETQSGRRIRILANISGGEDLAAAVQSGAEGVGLYRTEFLYLQQDSCPDEEMQFACYREAAEAFRGKPVVFRTADLGGDKSAAYLGLSGESDARGIRISLRRGELFRTQLRSLYRASAYGKVLVMFPMVSSPEELRQAKEHCRAVREELASQGIPYDADMPLGMMVETAEAAARVDEFARLADFFSVGTNDLSQYLLGVDRMAEDCDPRHPTVLKAVKAIADAARKAGIPVCICGDMAADTELCETFLAMGVDSLSAAPAYVGRLKKAVRELD
ncbi:MAG: phosphoenolpyruvate--protein phosphotransferase [Oscillospiraceae bacterium]|nr:phosphoenolpyruvate--protein phosphotransferase [Oscillospiraceae bacterium]